LTPSFERNLFTYRLEIFHKTTAIVAAHSKNFVIVAAPFWQNRRVWRTDRHTCRRKLLR